MLSDAKKILVLNAALGPGAQIKTNWFGFSLIRNFCPKTRAAATANKGTTPGPAVVDGATVIVDASRRDGHYGDPARSSERRDALILILLS